MIEFEIFRFDFARSGFVKVYESESAVKPKVIEYSFHAQLWNGVNFFLFYMLLTFFTPYVAKIT